MIARYLKHKRFRPPSKVHASLDPEDCRKPVKLLEQSNPDLHIHNVVVDIAFSRFIHPFMFEENMVLTFIFFSQAFYH